jgi:hypothetical protein
LHPISALSCLFFVSCSPVSIPFPHPAVTVPSPPSFLLFPSLLPLLLIFLFLLH